MKRTKKLVSMLLAALMLMAVVPLSFAAPAEKATTVSIGFADVDGIQTFASQEYVVTGNGSFLIEADDYTCPRGYYYYPTGQGATLTVTNGVPNFTEIMFVVKAFGVAGGDGTTKLPYVILTPDDFDNIRNAPDKNYILGSDIEYGTGGHSMTYAIAPTFSGVLDGNGCKLSGIWSDCNDIENEGEYALFIENHGTIKNFLFEDIVFQAAFAVATVAVKNYGLIENCQVTEGSLYAYYVCEGYDPIAGDGGYLGGLVAINCASGIIRKCSVSYTYILTCTGPYEGGLVACNFGLIDECYTEFNPINRDEIFVAGMIYIGGLVGGNLPGGIIKNCYAGSSFGYLYAICGTAGVGGLVGANAGTVVCSGSWNQDIWVSEVGMASSHNCIGYSQYPETIEYVYYSYTDGCDTSNWEQGTALMWDELISGHVLEGWSSETWIFESDCLPILRWQNPTYVDITYTVRFLDYDNTVLKTETVRKGDSATAPSEPTRETYVFVGWSVNFSNIIADTDVYATYWLLGDVNKNNAIDSGDAILILRNCVGLIEFTNAEIKIGDVSKNASISTGDAVIILKYVAGMITDF